MIRVVIADDQALVRGGFRSILSTQADIEVVGEAADGTRVVELCRTIQPDVVLMDIRMPVLDGIAATRAVVQSGHARVLILTTFDIDEYVYAALKAGASGFHSQGRPGGRTARGGAHRRRRPGTARAVGDAQGS